MNVPVFKDGQNAKRIKQSMLFANSTISSKIFQFLRDNEKQSEIKFIEAIKICKNAFINGLEFEETSKLKNSLNELKNGTISYVEVRKKQNK